MHAAAASSAARKRRATMNGKGALVPSHNSEDLLRREAAACRGGSSRNLTRTNPRSVPGEGRMAASMPIMHERRRSSLISDGDSRDLDGSVQTNPELFLEHLYGMETDRLCRADLWHTANMDRKGLGEKQSGEGEGRFLWERIAPEKTNNSEGIPSKERFDDKCRRSKPRGRELSGHITDPASSEADDRFVENPDTTNRNMWSTRLDPLRSLQRLAGKIVNDDWVQNFILLLIVINAVLMGVATFPFVKTNPDILHKFEATDQAFLIVFTVESSMQLMYHGWEIFKDGFLVFDLLIVVLSWALEGAQVFRAFRIFRAMRLITRVSTLKNLVLALFNVAPKMMAIFMLLLLIFYIFSVMFTELFKDLYKENLVEEPYFSTIYDSLFTLFQMMTLDEWAGILSQILLTYTWAWLPFVVFISITAFVIMNLIIAVICDAVHVLEMMGKAGIHGSKASEGEPIISESGMGHELRPISCIDIEQRLDLFQQQFDEISLTQQHMMATIELLIKREKEKETRDPKMTIHRLRHFAGMIVNYKWVQNAILLLIVINAILMGVATFPFVKSNPDILRKFEVVDQIFLVLFTIESSMQLVYHGWTLFKDGFLVFDLLIVVLSWALEGAQVFRAFRIFRAMRLITRIASLKNLVTALLSVVPKMAAIMMLLLLIFYIFSVMFTELFKHMYAVNQVEEPYFSTLYDSLFTLFQIMTLDEWGGILYQIQLIYSWAWVPFVIFIVLTGFVVVNLIIAVICDAVHVLDRTGKAHLGGYDEFISYDHDSASHLTDNKRKEQRIEYFRYQLNDFVLTQERTAATIELLVKQQRQEALNGGSKAYPIYLARNKSLCWKLRAILALFLTSCIGIALAVYFLTTRGVEEKGDTEVHSGVDVEVPDGLDAIPMAAPPPVPPMAASHALPRWPPWNRNTPCAELLIMTATDFFGNETSWELFYSPHPIKGGCLNDSLPVIADSLGIDSKRKRRRQHHHTKKESAKKRLAACEVAPPLALASKGGPFPFLDPADPTFIHGLSGHYASMVCIPLGWYEFIIHDSNRRGNYSLSFRFGREIYASNGNVQNEDSISFVVGALDIVGRSSSSPSTFPTRWMPSDMPSSMPSSLPSQVTFNKIGDSSMPTDAPSPNSFLSSIPSPNKPLSEAPIENSPSLHLSNAQTSPSPLGASPIPSLFYAPSDLPSGGTPQARDVSDISTEAPNSAHWHEQTTHVPSGHGVVEFSSLNILTTVDSRRSQSDAPSLAPSLSHKSSTAS